MQEPDARERPIAATVTAEALERLAFHALCAVLALYLNEHLLYAERDARGLFHLFLGAVYLAPLAGRWAATRLGRIRTVRWASALHLAGLAVLALVESRAGLALGLALVAAGAGGAMPVTSALVGESLGAGGSGAAARGATALRRAVQAASLAAKLGAPLLLVLWGPRAAFGAAALALAAAVLLARRARAGAADGPVPPERHGFLRVVARALARLGTGKPGQDWLELARDVHPAEAVAGARAVLRLLPVFAALGLFWALFDQRASTWVFQARQLDLSVGGVQLSPAQLQALSPLLVLVVAPLLAALLPLLERRGLALPPLRRVGAGLFAAAGAFVAAAILQVVVDGGAIPRGLWQAPQYLLITVGEVLVSVTGLELAYAHAPRSMRGTIMSVGFLTVAAGNLLVAALGKLFRLDGAAWSWAFAALGVGGALAFRAVTRAWRTKAEGGPAAGSQV
jgi:POT family proton-dependent oligopeptide transporter